VLQTAWNFVNDSLMSPVMLRFRPVQIAAAALHLAARYCGEAPTGRALSLPDNFLDTVAGTTRKEMDGA
jgi:hypothetical protein